MTDTKYLSYNGLTQYDALIKAKIAEDDANMLLEAKKDIVSVDGGASFTLEDIFGEPPYTIEFTEETEELSNITVAAGSDYGTYRLRNVAIVTEVPTQMNDGDIALVINLGG